MILLVEDDSWTADCYTQWLQADGHEVAHARDAQAALDIIDATPPALILLDVLLPGASGVQLLHTLQSYADLARIPVIICSGSLPAQLPMLKPYGVFKVLDKAGLSPKKLRQTVTEVLANAAI